MQPTRALIALARMDLVPDPACWPLDELGGAGFTAAAIITDRMDLLPAWLAGPASAWRELPGPFRTVIKQRNPAMGAYCEHAVSGDRA
jgi:hypothetical protein